MARVIHGDVRFTGAVTGRDSAEPDALIRRDQVIPTVAAALRSGGSVDVSHDPDTGHIIIGGGGTGGGSQTDIPPGQAVFQVTHNLGTRVVDVWCASTSDWTIAHPQVRSVTENTVVLTFPSTITTTHHVVVTPLLPPGAATVVTQPKLPMPAVARGVNLCGPEFGAHDPTLLPGQINHDYTYNQQSSWNYLAGRGINYVRLPFRWERVAKPDGALTDGLDSLIGALDMAHAAGLPVLIDMHNYGRFALNGQWAVLGDGTLTATGFAATWKSIAGVLKGHPSVLGYGLMNEPHDLVGGQATWETASQQAHDAIREVDEDTLIYVGGYSWSGVRQWMDNHPSWWIVGHQGRAVAEGHYYPDIDNNGDFAETYDQVLAHVQPYGITDLSEMVAMHINAWLDWCDAQGVPAHLGEVGWDRTDARWKPVGEAIFNTAIARGCGVTAWAAGEWWWDGYKLRAYKGESRDPVIADVVENINPTDTSTPVLPPGGKTAITLPAGWESYTPLDLSAYGTHDIIRLPYDTDYLVRDQDHPTHITIRGGRNVVILGCKATSDHTDPRYVSEYETTGIEVQDYPNGQDDAGNPPPAERHVYIVGCRLTGYTLTQGIRISAPSAHVHIGDVRVDLVRFGNCDHRDGTNNYTKNHPDLIQPYGGAKSIEIDGFSGYSGYQGITLKVDNVSEAPEVTMRRVCVSGFEFEGIDTYKYAGHYMLYLLPGNHGAPAPHVTVLDGSVYVEVHPNSGWAGRSKFRRVRYWDGTQYVSDPVLGTAVPEEAIYPAPTSVSNGIATVPGVDGGIRLGRPTHDYVPAELVGPGYTP